MADTNMIVEITGESTSIVVESLTRNYTQSYSVAFGRQPLERIIRSHVREKHNLLIGARTAEAIRLEIGAALPSSLLIEVRARDAVEGVPRTVTLTGEEIRQALADSVALFVDAVRVALNRTPPEMFAEMKERGIILKDDALKDLDHRLSIETNLPVTVMD
jgi:rod shape-determining protein MreB